MQRRSHLFYQDVFFFFSENTFSFREKCCKLFKVGTLKDVDFSSGGTLFKRFFQIPDSFSRKLKLIKTNDDTSVLFFYVDYRVRYLLAIMENTTPLILYTFCQFIEPQTQNRFFRFLFFIVVSDRSHTYGQQFFFFFLQSTMASVMINNKIYKRI